MDEQRGKKTKEKYLHWQNNSLNPANTQIKPIKSMGITILKLLFIMGKK